MEIEIRRTKEGKSAYEIALELPEYFDENALRNIEKDVFEQALFGAFLKGEMIGFAVYKEATSQCVEMAWLGVSKKAQGKGVGTKLVIESLKELSGAYEICKVKTLAESDPYEPYKKTREFYKKLGFVPVETISPYPGWGDNPCQIFVKALRVFDNPKEGRIN